MTYAEAKTEFDRLTKALHEALAEKQAVRAKCVAIKKQRGAVGRLMDKQYAAMAPKDRPAAQIAKAGG